MPTGVRKFKETADFQSLSLQRLRNHKYFPVAMVVLAMLLVACVHIWQRVHVMTLVHEVAVLRSEHEQLVDIARKTQSDIAALSMTSRIEQYAADSLGLALVSADRLYTLIRSEQEDEVLDRLEVVISSIERIGEHLPVLTASQVNASELNEIKLDSTQTGGGGE